MHSPRELLNTYPIISEQVERPELEIILEALVEVIDAGTDGDVCEFGCFVGTTSLFLKRLLNYRRSNKKLFLYDSFEGLPEKNKIDESPLGKEFVAGELFATKSQIKMNFKKASLSLRSVKIKKGWFNELSSKDVPKKICFAFLDGDYYDSVKSSLHLISNKVQLGGLIIVDDYDNPALPGAKKAVDEFLLANNQMKLIKASNSLAIIKNTTL